MDYLKGVISVIPKLPEIVFLLLIGLFGIPILLWIFNKTMRRLKMSMAVIGVTGQIIRYIMWLLILMAILYQAGFTGLAATVSGGVVLTGVVLSQAFKNLVQDIVSGLALARDNDFEVGYKVEISGKFKGVVRKIGLRKVRLIDEQGYSLIIPNSTVEENEWRVLDRETKLKTTKRKT